MRETCVHDFERDTCPACSPIIERPVIIAIDGPAGAGKSTIARGLARRLGAACIETGAYFRAVALVAQSLAAGGAIEDVEYSVAAASFWLKRNVTLFADGTVEVLGDPPTMLHPKHLLTAPAGLLNAAASHPEVRVDYREYMSARIIELQPAPVVLVGRDTGIAFPQAVLKIFVTASADVRAARRGSADNIAARDESVVDLLRPLVDAHVLITTMATPEESIESALDLLIGALEEQVA